MSFYTIKNYFCTQILPCETRGKTNDKMLFNDKKVLTKCSKNTSKSNLKPSLLTQTYTTVGIPMFCNGETKIENQIFCPNSFSHQISPEEDLSNEVFSISSNKCSNSSYHRSEQQEKTEINNISSESLSTYELKSDRNLVYFNEYLALDIPMEVIAPEVLVSKPNRAQFKLRKWDIDTTAETSNTDFFVPPSVEELELDAALELNNEIEREKQRILEERRIQNNKACYVRREQEIQRKQYEVEDKNKTELLEMERVARLQSIACKEMQRRVDIDSYEELLVKKDLIQSYEPTEKNEPFPVNYLPPTSYGIPKELPPSIEKPNLTNLFDELKADELRAKKLGVMRIDEFERVKSNMAQQHLEKEKKLQALEKSEKIQILTQKAILIQRLARGRIGRVNASTVKEKQQSQKRESRAVVTIQTCIRGFFARQKLALLRNQEILQLVHGKSVNNMQRVWRGYKGRQTFMNESRLQATCLIQRVVRGFFGRNTARRELERLQQIRRLYQAALSIQCAWKTKLATDRVKVLRFFRIAATEIQRVFRGFSGRKKAARRYKWKMTEPGPERIKLGLELINESKDEFEKQRDEIDSLHHAQEKVETRVSRIYEELKESENELRIIENELQEIDEVEHHIEELVLSQKSMLNDGSANLNSNSSDTPSPEMKSDSMKKQDLIQMNKVLQEKKIERENKKQHLELELSLIFKEVEQKRNTLGKLEIAISEIEATRQRKDREFNRLQRNLMELLHDQKFELERLREKGIELEVATATSAAAAAATANKAREHELQTNSMFNQQEELMKFQFMSMSLSYFSSLNMLKQMRGFTSDTTATAISNSADTAAAAAAAAAAANIPSMKNFQIKIKDPIESAMADKEAELKRIHIEEKDFKKAKQEPFPDDCRLWTIQDVSRWLRGLSLDAYVEKFEEGCVDGEFLLELREEELATVLGVEHKLHRRKIMLSREKLRPLSQNEVLKRKTTLYEEEADKARKQSKIPTIDIVFSQARHGRLQRLQESIEEGFGIDTEDETGNTILMVAVQNNHRKMVEFLMRRGSSVNHTNVNGNSALHFALAYDRSGELAEFLIENGADDTIENMFGLTPYDGLGEEFLQDQTS